MRRFLLLLAAAWIIACPHGGVPGDGRPDDVRTLVVLHTNDVHGHIWGSSWAGSVAQRATLIESVRSEVRGSGGGAVLLLDAGDVRTGTLCSDRNLSIPDLEAMDVMGYDAMAMGNHELDQPIDVTLEQRSKIRIPVLAANLRHAERDEPVLDEYVLIERGGLRIAVLGLVTTDAVTTSTRGADPRLRFVSTTATAARLVPRLRQQADVVIVLSHLGQDEDRALAAAVEGIDVIVGGHSHDEIREPVVVGRTIVVQAGSDGRWLGRLDLEVGRGGVRLRGGRILPVTNDIPEAPEVVEVLRRYPCPEATETVIVLEEPLTREPLAGPGTSSVLSNLIADAFRIAGGADLALMNQGGIRAELDAGPVTAAEIHEVLPFDNTIVVVRVTGADLLDIARSIMARGREGRGLIFTSGMDFVYGPGDQVQVLVDGGTPVDPGRELTMALSSFLAEGGDGHPPLARLTRVRELDGTCAEVFADYLRGLDELVVDRRSRTRWVEGPQLTDPSPKSVLLPQCQSDKPQRPGMTYVFPPPPGEDKGGGSHRISTIPHDSLGLTVALDHPLPNPPPEGEGESIAIS